LFSKFFIYRPIFASVLSLVIVIAGIICIPMLPREELPQITPPTVVVTARWPGANAQDVAETVTTPIEEQVNGVDGMLYMSSVSGSDGSMRLTITFEKGTDPDMAQVLVQNRVSLAEPRLPEEVTREGVTVKKQSTSLTMVICLAADGQQYDALFLSNFALIRIKDVLARVPGVGDVQLSGAREFGMRIWLDPEQLAARSLTPAEVLRAVREQNRQIPAGRIGAPPVSSPLPLEYVVTTRGRLSDAEQFKQLVVATGAGGQPVLLSDVARVELAADNYDTYAQLNGSPTVAMLIYQLPGANAVAVAEDIRAELDRLASGADWPVGLEVVPMYDTSLFVSESIREVVVTLVVAVLLVFLVTYVFLQDLRATLVPGITIPVSLLGTFIVMAALGFSIKNQGVGRKSLCSGRATPGSGPSSPCDRCAQSPCIWGPEDTRPGRSRRTSPTTATGRRPPSRGRRPCASWGARSRSAGGTRAPSARPCSRSRSSRPSASGGSAGVHLGSETVSAGQATTALASTLEGAALVLGEPAPDARVLVGVDRELEALLADLAPGADALGGVGLLDGRTGRPDGEEQLRVLVRARCRASPVHGLGVSLERRRTSLLRGCFGVHATCASAAVRTLVKDFS